MWQGGPPYARVVDGFGRAVRDLRGKQVGRTVVILLCGGDKASQDRDIARAKRLAATL